MEKPPLPQLFAVSMAMAASMGINVFPLLGGSPSSKPRNPMPCKRCGKMTDHKKQYCSAECCKAAKKDN